MMSDNLKRLQKVLKWPSSKPKVASFDHGYFNKSNKKMFDEVLSKDINTILELGAWLGMSARYMLDNTQNAVVISVDTWSKYGFGEYDERWHPPYLKDKMDKMFEIFLVNCWDYQDRLIPLRMRTLDAIKLMNKLNISPDIIYIDANHEYDEVSKDLEFSFKYCPKSILVGDDWLWTLDTKDTPVKRAVQDFCKKNNKRVKVIDNWSWIIR
ncbi:MAG: class I SAM-dependent methyltransferase [Candidatus Pacebacteria bacterium]|nr:class I SAM-dependent methyltransferase [Candidatus Paceibacterota bacterium]